MPLFFMNLPNPQNALNALKQFTTVVADTGSFDSMRAYQPQDATTNPTLIIKALDQPRYAAILADIKARTQGSALSDRTRQVLVAFGQEILKIVPGRVSTEVDARLSFNVAGTIAEANKIIELYASQGIGRERVLIKVAATWEGIRAAQTLEKAGVHCNLTLIFSLTQAAACADAGVTLISPFVGRISDWHKKQGTTWATAHEDPGVRSVRRIYSYLKHHGYATEIMGASFRSSAQVLALSGCDLLTVSPELLEELLAAEAVQVRRVLDPQAAAPAELHDRFDQAEPAFRFAFNEDSMASEKLAEGIRLFVADGRKLDARLTQD